jgi:hypothetical protein
MHCFHYSKSYNGRGCHKGQASKSTTYVQQIDNIEGKRADEGDDNTIAQHIGELFASVADDGLIDDGTRSALNNDVDGKNLLRISNSFL